MDKPSDVDALLDNMRDEVDAALAQGASSFDTVPDSFTTDQRFTALGFQVRTISSFFSSSSSASLFALLLSVCPPPSCLPSTDRRFTALAFL